MAFFCMMSSCRKDSFITGRNALINFSADTLFFDTVFTSTGSITQSVKIINTNNQKLRLTSVKLMGGAQSFFHINIDGLPGPEQDDLELDAGDSLYIFVAVQITPGAANLPFVIQDSIQVSFNGNQRYLQLQAWGLNAHFLRNQVLRVNTTWDNTLPYVILGGLQVDTNVTLTIPAGCRIYLHADAPLLVDGSLLVTGSQYDSTRVYFQGDRLDEPYRDYPGAWPGIYFRETSTGNNLQWAVLKNAYQAIIVSAPPAGAVPKVILGQCIIDNSYDAGILGTQGSLQATNCLISNCGKNIELTFGGSYQFTHCTAASYSNNFIPHTQPVLSVSNYLSVGSTPVTADLHAGFTNCIFWGGNGNVDNEVTVAQQGSTVFSVNFSNCCWKVKNSPSGVASSNILANVDPLFDSLNNSRPYYDFHLRAGSPDLDKGIATGTPIDLDGNPRPVGLPDLGCYERQ
jgi:hypothetical protein